MEEAGIESVCSREEGRFSRVSCKVERNRTDHVYEAEAVEGEKTKAGGEAKGLSEVE